MSKLKVTETILRDGHQSLIATRLKTEQMLPILETMDNVGYHALEMWGGATFDACLRFLNEDPWQRLREIRKRIQKTKLQMLLRGQNVLGYKHYPDDVVKEFVKKSVGNGIDIIRIFDALNDVRNLETALLQTKKEGAHAQAAISYTLSPVHTLETYTSLAKEMESLGADSICIKDMSGLLKPYTAYELVKAIKREVNLPLEIHSHCTTGLAGMMYVKAVEAGADIIDTALSPFSMGTSQPPTESMVSTFEETEFETGLDKSALREAANHFLPIREKALESGLLNPKVLGVDIDGLTYQVPGGMLSNLVSQLSEQNALESLEEVLEEVPRVRKDLGYPPLVTPTSQIVGTQAVLNVITKSRYKMVPNEVKAYVKGMYGRPAISLDETFVKKIIGEEKTITCRPADKLENIFEKKKKEMAAFYETDEDVLSYIVFPKPAMDFFNLRQAQKYKIDSNLGNVEENVYPV